MKNQTTTVPTTTNQITTAWWKLSSVAVSRIGLGVSLLVTVLAMVFSHRGYEPVLAAIDGPPPEPPVVVPPAVVVAYTIAITACKPALVDGAKVLRHSVHLASSRNPSSGSAYDYRTIAFVHPDAAEECGPLLAGAGYEVRIKDSPVPLADIRNKFYADLIRDSGCCGEKEFLKLYGYTLTEFPVVVQLDIDTLLLRPFDELFDAMLASGPNTSSNHTNHQHSPNHPPPSGIRLASSMWAPNRTIDHPIHAFFTRDYNKNTKAKLPPEKLHIQGAFLILRPDPSVFEEFVELIKEGDFLRGRGWGAGGWGGTKAGGGGSDRFQGLVSYYYSGLHPGTAVELNPCYYNQNAGKPTKGGHCLTGRPLAECEDCRATPLPRISSLHFGGCRKPWECPYTGENMPWQWKRRGDACLYHHREWHRIRHDLERAGHHHHDDTLLGSDVANITNFYYGHCAQNPSEPLGYAYLPIQPPATTTTNG